MKTRSVVVLEIQQTEVHRTASRASSPELLFNYIYKYFYFWRVATFGNVLSSRILTETPMTPISKSGDCHTPSLWFAYLSELSWPGLREGLFRDWFEGAPANQLDVASLAFWLLYKDSGECLKSVVLRLLLTVCSQINKHRLFEGYRSYSYLFGCTYVCLIDRLFVTCEGVPMWRREGLRGEDGTRVCLSMHNMYARQFVSMYVCMQCMHACIM